MERYGDGCERCMMKDFTGNDGKEVIPVCSMWDPVVAPSFDEEGKLRYLDFLRTLYEGDIDRLNQSYGTAVESFTQLEPEEYWYTLKYGTAILTEEDVRKQTPQYFRWRDQAFWKYYNGRAEYGRKSIGQRCAGIGQ